MSGYKNTTYKFFTLEQLALANNLAHERNYNRQLDDDFLHSISSDCFYPVTFFMIHEHAQGEPVDAHIRCIVDFGGVSGAIDCDMELFNSLDTVEV